MQSLMIKIYQDLLLKNGLRCINQLFSDQSENNYSPNKGIRIKKSMLRSDLCDYSDSYIVVKGNITLEGDKNANK